MDKNQKPKSGTSAFSPPALAYLLQAGWSPKKVRPTSLYEEAYQDEGLKLLPKAKEFLRQYGGLMIKYELPNHKQDVLEFLAERAVVGMGGSGIECFEELIGIAPLCPIGHYLFGTCMLLMDRHGQVFGGSDTSVSFIGRTAEQAIGNILTGSEFEILQPRMARKTRSRAL